MTAMAAAAQPGRHPRPHPRRALLPLLLLALLLLLSSSSSSSAAAAATPTTATTATTRLRAALYSNVDATFERDAAAGLPPVFPTPAESAGAVVVPCFVSRSHSTPYIEVARHLAARGYRVILLSDVRNARWIRSLYGSDGGPFEVEAAPAEVTEPSWHALVASLEETLESANGARALAQFIAAFGIAMTREVYPWVRDYFARVRPALVVGAFCFYFLFFVFARARHFFALALSLPLHF